MAKAFVLGTNRPDFYPLCCTCVVWLVAETSAPTDAVQQMCYVSVPDFWGGTHVSPGGHRSAGWSIACSVLEERMGHCEYNQALTPHNCY